MNDPRWFKLLVRGIGILLIGISVPYIGSQLSYLAYMFYPSAGDRQAWPLEVISLVFILAQLLFGIYLLAGAPRLVRYCIRQVGYRCPGCDYDTRGLKGKCPECGLDLPSGHENPPA